MTAAFHPHRLVQLAAVVGAVCAVSFLPFLAVGGIPQIQQILTRLFPFQRGLNHAYWAGNVWALYSAVDRVLVKCEQRLLCARQSMFVVERLTYFPLNDVSSCLFRTKTFYIEA